jgi:hypothetical protein
MVPRRFLAMCLIGALAAAASALAHGPAARASITGWPWRPEPSSPLPLPQPCLAPLEDVLVGGVIDPTRRGFTLRSLGEAFELLTVALRSEGDCAVAESNSPSLLILDSSWRERGSGASLWVSQRQGGAPVPNVLDGGFASFTAGGYAFTLWAQGESLPLLPFSSFVAPAQAAPRSLRAAGAPRLTLTAQSHPAPPPGGGGDASALLERAIGDLAPEVSLACFFLRQEGGWGDLATLGIGDPRPAVPADFVESGLSLQFLAHPPASCPPPTVDPGDGVMFWASFTAGADGSLNLGAWALPPGTSPWPGRLSTEGASWTSARHVFSVAASRGGEPLGLERIRALALALDPSFVSACLLRDRLLGESDLPALQLRPARAPASYELVTSSLRAEELIGNCPADLAYRGGIFLDWQFADPDGRAIAAQAVRGSGGGGVAPAVASRVTAGPPGIAVPPTGGGPTSSTNFLVWTDANGTSYTVYGYSSWGGAGPSYEELVFVAKSLDPGFAG